MSDSRSEALQLTPDQIGELLEAVIGLSSSHTRKRMEWIRDLAHRGLQSASAPQPVRLELLSRLQAAATPTENEAMDAVIPAALWREFVDAHAEALYDAAHATPASGSSERAVAEKCAEIAEEEIAMVVGDAIHHRRRFGTTGRNVAAAIRAYAATLPAAALPASAPWECNVPEGYTYGECYAPQSEIQQGERAKLDHYLRAMADAFASGTEGLTLAADAWNQLRDMILRTDAGSTKVSEGTWNISAIHQFLGPNSGLTVRDVAAVLDAADKVRP